MKTFDEFLEEAWPTVPSWIQTATDGKFSLADTIFVSAKHYLISTSEEVLGRKATRSDEKKNLDSYLNELYKRFKAIDSTQHKKDVERVLKDTIVHMQKFNQKN